MRELDVVYESAYWHELGKGLTSMVVEVRLASTSLRKMRRPRSPGAVRVGASPRAPIVISSAMSGSQGKIPVVSEIRGAASQV